MRSNYDQRICPELNDAVFTDKPPFDILGLPHCAKKDDITINLHMSKFGFECILDYRYLPNGSTEMCFSLLNSRSYINKVVIIIHGFMCTYKANWVKNMKDAIQDTEENTAIIVRAQSLL